MQKKLAQKPLFQGLMWQLWSFELQTSKIFFLNISFTFVVFVGMRDTSEICKLNHVQFFFGELHGIFFHMNAFL